MAEEVGARILRNVRGDFEEALGSGAFGMDNSFTDTLMGQVRDNLYEVDVLNKLNALELVANSERGLRVRDCQSTESGVVISLAAGQLRSQ